MISAQPLPSYRRTLENSVSPVFAPQPAYLLASMQKSMATLRECCCKASARLQETSRDFRSAKTSKQRRNELKSLRSSRQGVAELWEGTTYSTGKDISGIVTLVDILQYFSIHVESIVQFGWRLKLFYPGDKILDNGNGLVVNYFLLHSTGRGCTLSDLITEADVEILPPWIEPAASSALSSSVSVAFNLETTGLGPLSSMTQISTAVCGTDRAFRDQPISQQSTDVTGVGTCHHSWQTVLTMNGKPVASSTLREGMELFPDFLSQFSKVLLVAHSGKAFDMKVLTHQAHHCDLEAELVAVVAGFAYTLLAFRHHLKGQIPKLFWVP